MSLKAVCFLLGDNPASEFYMPTFRNTLFNLHRQVGACRAKTFPYNTTNMSPAEFILHAPTCLWRWNRVFRNVGI